MQHPLKPEKKSYSERSLTLGRFSTLLMPDMRTYAERSPNTGAIQHPHCRAILHPPKFYRRGYNGMLGTLVMPMREALCSPRPMRTPNPGHTKGEGETSRDTPRGLGLGLGCTRGQGTSLATKGLGTGFSGGFQTFRNTFRAWATARRQYFC